MSAVTEAKIAARWGMSPSAFVPSLPKSGISIARWRRTRARAQFSRSALRADYYLLSLVLKPMNADAFVEGRQVWSGPIRANSVRIVAPDCERRWSSDSDFDLLHLMIPTRAVAEMVDGDATRVHFVDPLYSRDDTIQQLGHQLLWAMEQAGPFAMEMADGLTSALLAYLLQQYASKKLPLSGSSLRPAQLKRVAEFILSRVSTGVSLPEMAREAGMSPYHFSRQFRLATGETPYRYALIKRIERAKERLREHDNDILEVAIDCGFKDASHFSRAFKSIVGFSPREYRRHN